MFQKKNKYDIITNRDGVELPINHVRNDFCSDVFFYDLAYKLGIDKIHDSLDLFQFGKNTNIDLPGELGGVLPSREWKKLTKMSLGM